ncbi:MAG: MFS transporter [Parvibaculales bacterium]
MTYFAFIRRHWQFLLFGFFMMGLSNFGQTFFIALYSNEIRDAFDLSNAGFGALYSAATLLSAFVMVYSGRFIDSWPLRRFTLFVLAGLALGCIVMGLSSHIVVLFIALFMLRQFGQGLSSHTGMTSAGRAFDKNRGQAVSMVQLGYAGFEGFFPLMAVTAIALLGWQQSWLVYAAVLLLIAMPLQTLLAGHEPQGNTEAEAATEAADSDRAAMLRDKRFYMVLPLYLAPPFLLTGVFFHQVHLAETRNWSLEALAAAFTLYAFFKVTTSLITGPLIDRLSARKLMPFSAIPLILAFGLIVLPEDLFGAATPFVYMALIGINLGTAGPISGGLWPEMFGTKHLGAIRSLTSPIVITSTAASPVLFGMALDAGIGFAALAEAGQIFLLVGALLAFWVAQDKLSDK